MKAQDIIPIVVLSIAIAACRKHSSTTEQAEPTTDLSIPPVISDPLHFEEMKNTRDYGMPQGCRSQFPMQRATLPSASIRIASQDSDAVELAMALDTNGDQRADRSAIVPLNGAAPRALPWASLDEAPVFAHSADGWLLVQDMDVAAGMRRALLWRERDKGQSLAEGDDLGVSGAACVDRRCAVLTSLADRVKGSGASVFFGASNASAASWKRVDIHANGAEPFRPLSIVDLRSDGTAIVTLEADHTAELWSVTQRQSSRVASFKTDYGTYDVVLSDPPVAIVPGAPPEACEMDRFDLRFVDATGALEHATIHVAPEAIFARRLERGFFLAWIAPVSCRNRTKMMVSALLTDDRAHPASPTMAVGEAESFAVATHGATVDLWLQRPNELVWLRARCAADPLKTPPKPAPSSR